MNRINPEDYLQKIPKFKEYAHSVSRGIHDLVLRSRPLRILADLLHGVWLGHPLHPVLTDVAIGAWMSAGVLDLLANGKHTKGIQKAADQLTALGTAAAVPTALAGIADYSTIAPKAMSTGAAHGLLNATGLVLYVLSLINRRRGSRSAGVFFSSTALGLLTISAWLGGELSYKYRIGINKRAEPKGPQDWSLVSAEVNLAEGEARRVNVDGAPVLIYRYGGAVYAIGAVCAHDGGPLDEGKFDGLCVECPWHQSVYDLRDGRVVHGPSTYEVAAYETRAVNGSIQVRLKKA